MGRSYIHEEGKALSHYGAHADVIACLSDDTDNLLVLELSRCRKGDSPGLVDWYDMGREDVQASYVVMDGMDLCTFRNSASLQFALAVRRMILLG